MTWSDVTREPKPHVIRQFGILSFLMLGGFGIFRGWVKHQTTLGWSCFAAGTVFLLLGLVAPRILRWVFTVAMVVTFPIGYVVSQVVLAILFYVMFTGIGWILRAFGSGTMILKPKSAGQSYWEPKASPSDTRRYLRQY